MGDGVCGRKTWGGKEDWWDWGKRGGVWRGCEGMDDVCVTLGGGGAGVGCLGWRVDGWFGALGELWWGRDVFKVDMYDAALVSVRAVSKPELPWY